MLSEILTKIINKKYIDKKTKNLLINNCDNNEIIYILKSQKITVEKKID